MNRQEPTQNRTSDVIAAAARLSVKLPDKQLDHRLDFGCGAALGFAIGFIGTVGWGYPLIEGLAIGAGVAFALGILTVIFGEKVLRAVLEWFV